MKKISSKIRYLKFAIYKFLGKFIPYFKNMKKIINQSEIEEHLMVDITNFIRMKYERNVFVVENIEPITLPNKDNYANIPYKFYIHIKYKTAKFKISIEYYMHDNDLKFGLLYNNNYDYGECSLEIAMFNNYLTTSHHLINMIKGILQPAKFQ